MNDHRDEHPGVIDLLIDGTAPSDELRALLDELERDPHLRAEFDLQRTIDDALQRRFGPEIERIKATIGDDAPSGATPFRRTKNSASSRTGLSSGRRWLAAAAVIALLGGAGWIVLRSALPGGAPSPIPGPAPSRSGFIQEPPGAIYIRQLAKEFKPEWVCRDDAEFAKSVRDRLGTPLLAASAPRVSILGWAYNADYGDASFGVLSPRTMYLLTRVEGEPVVLLIDEVEHDRAVEAPTPEYLGQFRKDFPNLGPLQLFRREVGDLVAYEITPLDEPRVLELLYIPAPDEAADDEAASQT